MTEYYTGYHVHTGVDSPQVSYDDLTDQPVSFPPGAHAHAASDITQGIFGNGTYTFRNAEYTPGTTTTVTVCGTLSVPFHIETTPASGNATAFQIKNVTANRTIQIGITNTPHAWGSGTFYIWGTTDSSYALKVDSSGSVTIPTLSVTSLTASLPWTSITDKPSTYTPSSHNHAASDTNSGTFETARIPDLSSTYSVTSHNHSGVYAPVSHSQAASTITASSFAVGNFGFYNEGANAVLGITAPSGTSYFAGIQFHRVDGTSWNINTTADNTQLQIAVNGGDTAILITRSGTTVTGIALAGTLSAGNISATKTANYIPKADANGYLNTWLQFGSSTGTVCAGDDSRLSNSRTPTAHQLDSATYHTVSGLTAGHVLQATGATTFGFGAIPAHNHSASQITAGTFGSGTFNFPSTLEAQYLDLLPWPGSPDEGGELRLKGAGDWGHVQIDNYQGHVRFHSFADTRFLKLLNGALYANSTTATSYFSHSVGINQATPRATLDVRNASSAQLFLTHTDNSVYTSFRTDANGNLTITPSGGYFSSSCIAGTFYSASAWAPVVGGTNTANDATTATFRLYNSRGNNTTQANDYLGILDFYGYNGGGKQGAAIESLQTGAAGATYIPACIRFLTGTDAAAPAERMRITSDGKVGINNTAPALTGTISTPHTHVTQITGALSIGESSQGGNNDGLIQLAVYGFASCQNWNGYPTFGVNIAVKSEGSTDTLYTPLTHANIGYSGIQFRNGNGFYVYSAWNTATTAGATITPTPVLNLTNGTFGIGTGATAAAKRLEVYDTATQLRLSYTQATKYVDLTCQSNGSLYITPYDAAYVQIQGQLYPDAAGTREVGSDTIPYAHMHTNTMYVNYGTSASVRTSFTTDANGWLDIGPSGSRINISTTGNRANTILTVHNSMSAIGAHASAASGVSASRWDSYNNGSNPSWCNVNLSYYGESCTGTYYGVSKANLAVTEAINASNWVFGTNGQTDLMFAPCGSERARFKWTGSQLRISHDGSCYVEFKSDSGGNCVIYPIGGGTANSCSISTAAGTSYLQLLNSGGGNSISTEGNNLYVGGGGTAGPIYFRTGWTTKLIMDTGGKFYPTVTSSQHLGDSSYRWNCIYGTTLDINANMTVASNGTISSQGSKNTYNGMIECWYAANDRYGLGQFTGGVTALYTSDAYAPSAIQFGRMTSASAFTALMTISHDGLVGIGCTPGQKLDVAARVKFRSDGGSTAGIWLTGSDAEENLFVGQTTTASSSNLGFWHGGAWRFTLSSTGNVGIGIADGTAAKRLQVSDASNQQIRLTYTGGSYVDIGSGSTGGLYVDPVAEWIEVDGHIYPNAAGTREVGSDTKPYAHMHTNSLYLNYSTGGTVFGSIGCDSSGVLGFDSSRTNAGPAARFGLVGAGAGNAFVELSNNTYDGSYTALQARKGISFTDNTSTLYIASTRCGGDWGTKLYIGKLTTCEDYTSAPVDKFTFDVGNGRLGIGDTDPSHKLSIYDGGIGFSGASLNDNDKKLYAPADGDLEWMTHNNAGNHGFAISHQGTKAVYLNTSGNSYLNGGNVGIGCTPSAKLHVYQAGEQLRLSYDGTYYASLYADSVGQLSLGANGTYILCVYNTGGYKAVYPAGTSNTVDLGTNGQRWQDAYTNDNAWTTSDKRLKENILPTFGLNFISALKPISYKWKDTEEKSYKRQHHGFIAQELKETMDGLGISETDFAGYSYDEKTDTYAIRYSDFIAPMVKAIQELKAEIDDLKKQLAA